MKPPKNNKDIPINLKITKEMSDAIEAMIREDPELDKSKVVRRALLEYFAKRTPNSDGLLGKRKAG